MKIENRVNNPGVACGAGVSILKDKQSGTSLVIEPQCKCSDFETERIVLLKRFAQKGKALLLRCEKFDRKSRYHCFTDPKLPK